MKTTASIVLAASSLISATAQAAPSVRLPALSGALAPTSLGALPAVPSAGVGSMPITIPRPDVPSLPGMHLPLAGLLQTPVRVVTIVIGPPNPDNPRPRVPSLSTVVNFGEDVIYGLGKVAGPPQPPRNDPPAFLQTPIRALNGLVGRIPVADIPKLSASSLSTVINFGEDVIYGLGKVAGPPQPPKNDPPTVRSTTSSSDTVANVGLGKVVGPPQPPR
jgi:hypothetical protein